MNKVKIGKTAVAVALCAAAWAAGAAERIELNGAGTLLKWPCGIAGQKNPGVYNGVRRVRRGRRAHVRRLADPRQDLHPRTEGHASGTPRGPAGLLRLVLREGRRHG